MKATIGEGEAVIRRHPERENYIVFSDVHLGADLVQHARPWTVARLRRAARIDRDLASMLDHYRERRDPARPWCLVIAGDLVDFIGISIAPRPDERFETELTDEEHAHGLGSAQDHAVAKMRAVAGRHRLVFDRLARFLADGNSLVLVRGNHDVDFHWEPARAAFVEALVEALPEVNGDARARLAERIEFAPWFYWVEGLLWVEHGHQYDAMCSYPSPLVPESPSDPRRIGWSISDVLLRMVVRPTPGLSSEGHEHLGGLDYLRLAWRLGARGAARLFVRYASAILHLVRASRTVARERVAWLRAEHERRVADLSHRWHVTVEAMHELTRLHAPPVSGRALAILASLLVDRVAMIVAGVLLLVAIGVLVPTVTAKLVAAGLAIALGAALYVRSRWRRASVMNPARAMRHVAERIVKLFPSRFVVMGHTHAPVCERVGAGATYVNVGAWSVDELDPPGGAASEPARTHLVIRHVDGVARAELVRWDADSGPRAITLPPPPSGP